MARKYKIWEWYVWITENEKLLIWIPLWNINNFDELPLNSSEWDIYYVLNPKTVLGITTKRKYDWT